MMRMTKTIHTFIMLISITMGVGGTGLFIWGFFLSETILNKSTAIVIAIFFLLVSYGAVRNFIPAEQKYVRIIKKKIDSENISVAKNEKNIYYAQCRVDKKLVLLKFKDYQDYSYIREGFEYVAKIKRDKIMSIDKN